MNKKTLLSLLLCSTIGAFSYGFVQTNFFDQYDAALRLPYPKKNKKFQLGTRFEYGSREHGKSWDDKRKNVLQLHDDKQLIFYLQQDAIDSNIKDQAIFNNLKAAVRTLPAGVEDTIANIVLKGDFEQTIFTVWDRYRLPFDQIPGDLYIYGYLPIIWKKMHVVPELEFSDDVRVTTEVGLIKQHFTSDLADNLQKLACLDISPWSKQGAIGDISLIVEWYNRIELKKSFVKNVTFQAKTGVSFPAGDNKDEDRAFSMPLGYDGAWLIPFGIGTQVDFPAQVRVGLDLDLLMLTDKTKNRRMKTHEKQTEFLLLNKGKAKKEHGLTVKLHSFVMWHHFFGGLSLKAAYEYKRHEKDELVPVDENFTTAIINTAKSLEEWESHNLIFHANWDSYKSFDWLSSPQVNVYVKVPVGGKNIIDAYTVGGQLAFNF